MVLTTRWAESPLLARVVAVQRAGVQGDCPSWSLFHMGTHLGSRNLLLGSPTGGHVWTEESRNWHGAGKRWHGVLGHRGGRRWHGAGSG